MKFLHLHACSAFFIGAVIAVCLTAIIPPQAFAESARFNADTRYFFVQPGQTLNNIVRRLYPESKPSWPRLKSEIMRLNPQAFPGNKASNMKAGVRLTLPARYVAKKPQPPVQVGTVLDARGRTVAVGRDRAKRKLTKGKPVYLGDRLMTGGDGAMRLQMIDDAVIDLQCFSIMVIENYSISSRSRKSVLNLLQGGLRKVTGNIGKRTGDVYELKTPVASLGVRGTEYAMRVLQSKACDGYVAADDGMYLQILDGAVDVYNKADRSVVDEGGSLYISSSRAKHVDKGIEPGVLFVGDDAEQGDTSIWWWILGGVALIALI